MRRLFFFSILFLLFIMESSSQNSAEESTTNDTSTSPDNTEYDILIKNNGEKLYVKINEVSDKYIHFTYPGEVQGMGINRRDVKDIIYKSQKKASPDGETTTDLKIDWRKVIITKEKEDVEGLIKMGEIVGVAEGSKRGYSTSKSLELNAIIILRKKAAALNADVVLITNMTVYRGYGDIPKTTLEAIAYSTK